MPVALFAIGLIHILERFDNEEFQKSILILIMLVLLVIFLDAPNIEIHDFFDRMRIANSLSLVNKGGGIIGGFWDFSL